MENLKAEAIKEALENAERTKMNLERCKYGKEKPNCSECDFKPWIKPICQRLLCSVALELITSQDQKIKELSEENERLSNRITCQVVLPDEKIEEIKNDVLARVELDIKAIQADTVRKMQELFNERVGNRFSYTGWYLKETIFPEIAKELTESEKL